MGLFIAALSKASPTASLKGSQGCGLQWYFIILSSKVQFVLKRLYHFLFHVLFFSFYLLFDPSLIPQNLGFGEHRFKEKRFQSSPTRTSCG